MQKWYHLPSQSQKSGLGIAGGLPGSERCYQTDESTIAPVYPDRISNQTELRTILTSQCAIMRLVPVPYQFALISTSN